MYSCNTAEVPASLRGYKRMNRGASAPVWEQGTGCAWICADGEGAGVCDLQKSPAPPSPLQPQTHSRAPCTQVLLTMRGWERGPHLQVSALLLLEEISPKNQTKKSQFSNRSSPRQPEAWCKGGGSVQPICSPQARLASLDVGFPRKNSWLRELCGGLKRACRKTQPLAIASSGAGPS